MSSSPSTPLSLTTSADPIGDEIMDIMRMFVDGQSDPALLLSTDLELLSSNTAFASLIQMRARAIERKLKSGGTVFDLFSSAELQREVFEDVIRRSTRACLYDVTGTTHGGDTFIVIVTMLPIQRKKKECIGVVVLLRDVTAEVGLQQTYKDLLQAEQKRGESLELEVASRTHELRGALEEVTAQAQELEKSRQREVALQKSVFAGRLATGLAHEFNSPLACVLSNQSYLKSRLEELAVSMDPSHEAWTDFFSEAVEVIDENQRSMERLSATLRTLQEFVLTNDPQSEEEGPKPISIAEVLRDAQLELNRSDIDEGTVEFTASDESLVSAYGAEISLAIHSLIRFLLDHEAEPTPGSESFLEPEQPAGTPPLSRRVRVTSEIEGMHCLIILSCAELIMSPDEAENAFDPSLVVDGGNRVKLSVDLSVSAARIARSGGSVQFEKSDTDGTIIKIRLMCLPHEAQDEHAA